MKIGIIGAAGRMGRNLTKAVVESGCKVSGGIERKGSEFVGHDIGEVAGIGKLNLKIGDDLEKLVLASDAIIDFTSPESTLKVAELAAKNKKIHIIGTTGLSDEQKKQIEKFAKSATIVMASNMSFGVNLLAELVEKVAGILDESYDIEIVEMHHNKKVDAPSGTALMLGNSAAAGRKKKLSSVECRVRDGVTGPRKKGEIGFATLRGGDVIGDHTVIFATEGERVELTHKASDRSVFARGAVKAALWAKGKKKGLYSMHDVIGKL